MKVTVQTIYVLIRMHKQLSNVLYSFLIVVILESSVSSTDWQVHNNAINFRFISKMYKKSIRTVLCFPSAQTMEAIHSKDVPL